MIKAVTFDFWNTLYADSNFEGRLVLRIDYLKNKFAELGLNKSLKDVEEIFKDTGQIWLDLWESGKAFTPYDFTKTIFEKTGLKPPPNIIKKVSEELGEITLEVPPKLVCGVPAFLEAISKDFKIGLISDTGATPGRVLKKIMERDGIKHYFKSFVFSDEINSTKPAKKNFMKALEPFNVAPKDALHIGDMERTDIAGAKAAGMKAVLFTAVNNNKEQSTKSDLVVSSYDELSLQWRELVNND